MLNDNAKWNVLKEIIVKLSKVDHVWYIIFCMVALTLLSTTVIKKCFSLSIMPTLSTKQLDPNILPTPISKMIRHQTMPLYWALIIIKKNTIYSYISDNKPRRLQKLESILSIIKYCYSHGMRIPDGEYFIDIVDGIHIDYEWPLLGFAGDRRKVAEKKIILIPDYEALSGYNELFRIVDAGIALHPWEKKSSKIFWRGKATGFYFPVDPHSTFPRKIFLDRSRQFEFVDAGFTGLATISSDVSQFAIPKDYFSKYLSQQDSLGFKYLMDVDGTSCSFSRMAWILYSNSVLFKHKSVKIQWYYDKLIPYIHYVPIDSDFSNLTDQFHWAEENSEIALKMTRQARDLAKKTFNNKSVALATFNAFVNYNAVVNKQEYKKRS